MYKMPGIMRQLRVPSGPLFAPSLPIPSRPYSLFSLPRPGPLPLLSPSAPESVFTVPTFFLYVSPCGLHPLASALPFVGARASPRKAL